jgi:pyridoxamine 5'-phosphate oxidase
MLSRELLDTFNDLLREASSAGEPEPTAMTLATATPDGRVSARIVLLKQVDERGFVFHTNRESLKGLQLEAHARAALLFHWKHLRNGVQVRVEGCVSHVSHEESDAYFATRPRGSQIGAWASLQSQPLASREAFDARIAEYEARFPDTVPRPPHWGGYRVAPARIEFWYGAAFRLHERHAHELVDGTWRHALLFP